MEWGSGVGLGGAGYSITGSGLVKQRIAWQQHMSDESEWGRVWCDGALRGVSGRGWAV